jgi:hypothetical protein
MKQITSLKIEWHNWGMILIGKDILKVSTTIYRRRFLAKNEIFINEEKPNRSEICKCDKNNIETFFQYLEKSVCIQNWNDDYSVPVCDGFCWKTIIRFSDHSCKIVKGTVEPPPFAKDIEKQILELAKFKEKPPLFCAR